jgi:steroid delta-isomerase-like uncharacterized protein
MSAEDHATILEHFAEEVWRQGNLTVADEVLAADYVLHDSVGPIRGPEDFKQYAAEVRLAFPDLQFTLDEVIVYENKAVAHWTFQGSHTGRSPNLDISPTGRRVVFSGVTIYRLVDGKIAEEWNTMDTLRLLQQMGVPPS